MSYFRNVPMVPYRFGTSEDHALHQNLSRYTDLVDQVRNNSSFYQKYTILDGERPDTLSQKLYGSPKYYFTFFLMNDNIRERGWPLTNQQIIELAQKERNNTVITTTDPINANFPVGDTVTGQSSGVTGTVIKRNLDLGQIVVGGDKSYVDGEILLDISGNTITIGAAENEYNAAWRYEDSSSEPIDIDPFTGPGAQLVERTYTDRYIRENEELKDIIVIKPGSIQDVFEQFQAAMRT